MLEKQLLGLDYLKGIFRTYNPVDIPEEYCFDLNGLRVDRGFLRRHPGSEVYINGAFSGIPLRLIPFVKEGVSFLVLVTTTGVFVQRLDTWINLTLGASGSVTGAWGELPWGEFPWGGSSSETEGAEFFPDLNTHISYTVFPVKNELSLVLVNLYAGICCWDGNKLTAQSIEGLEDMSIHAAFCVTSFMTHLLFGRTIEGGEIQHSRIRWSAIGDAEDYVSRTAGFVDLLDTPDWLMEMMPWMDRVIVYKSNSIWEGSYVGYPKIFNFEPFIRDVGLLAPASLCCTKEKGQITSHIFLGTDNIYEFTQSGVVPLGESIWHMLFGPNAIVNKNQRYRAQGLYVHWTSEYYLSMPLLDEEDLRTVFVYNFIDKSWTRKTFDEAIYALSSWKEDEALRWNMMLETWEHEVRKWNFETISKSNPLSLYAGLDRVYKLDFVTLSDDTEYVEAYFESKDYEFSFRTRWVEFMAEVIGSWTLYYSYNEGYTWASFGTKTSSGVDWEWKKWGMNFTKEKVRFKLVAGEGDFKARKLGAYYVPRVE